jgi:photosystem II stability/assembly factor-like uncharacterized protein
MMTHAKAARRPEAGFSLIEIVVAVALMAMLAITVFQFSNSILVATQSSRSALAAVGLIEREVEVVRNLSYADVGVQGGIPSGVLEPSKPVAVGGMAFIVTTTVRNIDDPFDGTIGGTPGDLSPADYKLVELEARCTNCKSNVAYTMTTTAAPKGLETASENGALFVQVLNSVAEPVAAAAVHVENNAAVPPIVIDDVTDTNGWLRIIDAPPGANAYEITVTKPGHSTDRTYGVGDPAGNDNPTKPHANVAVQQVTQLTFGIDELGAMNIHSVYDNCTPVPDVDFTLAGSKTIGDNPIISKFSGAYATDSGGQVSLPDMEWDSYAMEVTDLDHNIRGTSPASPVLLDAGATQDVDIVLADLNPNSLLVTVKDQLGNPLNGAAVELNKGSQSTVHTTDTDFGAGTPTGVAVAGTGADASLELAASPQWLAVSDRGGAVSDTTDTNFGAGTLDSMAVSGAGVPAGLIISGHGWQPMTTPTYNTVDTVSMVNPTFGMASAYYWGNEVMLWNGSAWSITSFPNSYAINDIKMNSNLDGWAVGARASVMARWNGFAWQDVTNVNNWGNSPMYAVDCFSSGNCMVAGYNDYYSYWNGSSWTSRTDVNESGSPELYGLAYADATHVVVVGEDGYIRRGSYSGGSWSWDAENSGTSQDLYAVDCASNGDCFAVGGNGTIRRWNGSSWSGVTSGTSRTLRDVAVYGATEAFAAGDNGTILHWNGAAWSVEASGSAAALQTVAYASSSVAFVGGSSGTVLRLGNATSGSFVSRVLDSGASGTVWNAIDWTADLPTGGGVAFATRASNSPTPSGSFYSAGAVDSGSATINASGGAGRYLQYSVTLTTPNPDQSPFLEDVTLTYGASFTSQLHDVAMTDASSGWAVGGGGALRRWNGSTWLTFTSPTSQSLFGVAAVSGGDGWAVGENGTILRWNGTSWSAASSPTANDLNAVYLATSGDGWAVGDGNTVLRLTGSAWSAVAGPFTANIDLYDVSMISSGSGQLVGEEGRIAAWNGAAWSAVSSPTSSHLYAVDFIDASTGWAVGGGGAILVWNGAAWSTDTDITGKNLTGLYARTADDVWAVGAADTSLHYTPLHAADGTYVSPAIDGGIAVPWYTVSWTPQLPGGTAVTVATRTGDSLPLTGSWSGEISGTSGTVMSGDGRYFQYRVTMTSAEATITPALDDITVTYGLPEPPIALNTGESLGGQSDWSDGPGLELFDGSAGFSSSDGNIDYSQAGGLTLAGGGGAYAPSGILTSATFNVGDGAALGSLVWLPVNQPPAAGAASVRLQVAANNDNATWVYLGPDGTEGTYYTATDTPLAAALGGNRYLRYRLYLSTEDDAATPRIEDLYFNYTPACGAVGTALFQGLAIGDFSINVTKAGYEPYSISSYSLNQAWEELDVTLTQL